MGTFNSTSNLCSVQGNAQRKAEQLRAMVGRYGQCADLATVRCPLHLDPEVWLEGLVPDACGVFKSALSPLRLVFRTAPSGELPDMVQL